MLQPENTDGQLDGVAALLAANRVDEARSMLAALPGAEASARAQSLLGEASEKQGRFEDAVEHLMRAAQLDPNEENAWQLGAEFLRHWSFAEAIREFEAAAGRFPTSTRIRFGLGAASLRCAAGLREDPSPGCRRGHGGGDDDAA